MLSHPKGERVGVFMHQILSGISYKLLPVYIISPGLLACLACGQALVSEKVFRKGIVLAIRKGVENTEILKPNQ